MKPIGPLMREHRLIERMINLIDGEIEQITRTNKANIDFLMEAVEFIRTYADMTHHGKEEHILFKALDKKQLNEDHRRIMNELISEHAYGRKIVTDLISAVNKYRDNDANALGEVQVNLKQLAAMYPSHIEKEDKRFFYPCLEYLSSQEQEEMLKEFWEFDKNVVHRRYEDMIVNLEKRGTKTS